MAKRRGNHEGSIYQRKADKRWVASLTIAPGKRRYFYGKTRVEARDKLRAAQRDYADGRLTSDPKLTLSAYLAHWLDTKKNAVQERTHWVYEYQLRKIVLKLGTRKLEKLTALDVQKCYADLIAEGLSVGTVRHAHTVLSSALKDAVRWRIITWNPASEATVPKDMRQEIRVLNASELKRLLKAAQETRHAALIGTLALTGMRVGEATALMWTDVDLQAGTIHIRRTHKRLRNGTYDLGATKTRSSDRTVYLPLECRALLATHRAIIPTTTRIDAPNLVFPRHDGKPLSADEVRLMLLPILKRAGLPLMRVHDLRHTFATLALAGGANPRFVQEQLGHHDIKTTLGTYGHVLPSMHGQIISVLDALLENSDSD